MGPRGTFQIKTTQGFTLVEILIAVGISMVSVFGLAWSFTELAKNKTRMETISAISSLEASLTEELQKESYYTDPAIKASLRAGAVPAALEFTVQGASMGQNFNFTIRPGETVNFTSQFQECPTLGANGCRYSLSLQLQPGSNNRMSYAYSFRTAGLTSASGANVSVNYEGAAAQGGAIDSPVDFSLTIPYDFYLANNLALACDPTTSVGVSGIDRQQAQVSCIDAPQILCPNGTMPKSLRSVSNNGRNGVEFNCGAPALTLRCPPGYSLLDLETQSLDPAQAPANQKVGRCVRAAAATATWPTKFVGKRVSGEVCPPNYISTSTCRLVNIVRRAGSCSPWCSSSVCGSESTVENPVGTFTRTTNYACGNNTPLVMPANPGRIIGGFSGRRNSGRRVDCRVHFAQQDCNAVWDADVEVTVQCQDMSGTDIVNAF